MTADWSGPVGPAWPAGLPRALQVAGLTAFGVGLAAVAAATCVLSYACVPSPCRAGFKRTTPGVTRC
jgi:hypothetical protein